MMESYSPINLTAEITNSLVQLPNTHSKKINRTLLVTILIVIGILVFLAYFNERSKAEKRTTNTD